MISDSWSWTTDLNAQDGITGFQERDDAVGAPTMILQESPQELAFDQAHSGNPCQEQPCGARWALWPSAIVADTDRKRALIFYMLVSAAPGNFNFQAVGNSVATWQNFQDEPQRPTINPPVVPGHPDFMFNQNEPNFGSTAFVNGDTLYVYGCGTPTNTGKQCMLGQVAPANVLNRSAWTFYAGNGNWSSQIGDAVSVLTADNILSISWNAYLQQYVAVYSAPLSLDVMMRTSPNPEGPWSGELKIFTAMQPAQGGNVYDAHAHSEYDVDGGRIIYVSYSRSTGLSPVKFGLCQSSLDLPAQCLSKPKYKVKPSEVAHDSELPWSSDRWLTLPLVWTSTEIASCDEITVVFQRFIEYISMT